MQINHLPVKTWNHLHMNDTAVDLKVRIQPFTCKEEIPEGILKEVKEKEILTGIRTGLGDEFDSLMNESNLPVSRFVIPKETKESLPLYLDLDYDRNVSPATLFEFDAEDNSEATVIQYFTSEKMPDDADPAAFVRNKYHVGKNAVLTLIQVQALADDRTFFNDIGGTCEEGGSFRLIRLILGGKATYAGAFASLPGKKSAFESDIAYDVREDHLLDMNYVADHTGKQTESRIDVSGVLAQKARKLFRGTIDFHKGCAGAKGSELEDVLLLDEGIVNQTIPLILCDEEDVEGSHGASIGRPDEDLMLYLASRGLSEEVIYRMMARAKVDAVAGKIGDERTRGRIAEFVGGEYDG